MHQLINQDLSVFMFAPDYYDLTIILYHLQKKTASSETAYINKIFTSQTILLNHPNAQSLRLRTHSIIQRSLLKSNN